MLPSGRDKIWETTGLVPMNQGLNIPVKYLKHELVLVRNHAFARPAAANLCGPCYVLSFLTDITKDRDRARHQALSRSNWSYSQGLAETGTGWFIRWLGVKQTRAWILALLLSSCVVLVLFPSALLSSSLKGHSEGLCGLKGLWGVQRDDMVE